MRTTIILLLCSLASADMGEWQEPDAAKMIAELDAGRKVLVRFGSEKPYVVSSIGRSIRVETYLGLWTRAISDVSAMQLETFNPFDPDEVDDPNGIARRIEQHRLLVLTERIKWLYLQCYSYGAVYSLRDPNGVEYHSYYVEWDAPLSVPDLHYGCYGEGIDLPLPPVIIPGSVMTVHMLGRRFNMLDLAEALKER